MIIKDILTGICEVAGIYVFWISLHWLSSELYMRHCVGRTLYEVLISPFVAPLPHCVAMRWIINNGGRKMEMMWIVLGKWLIERLIYYKYYKE